MVLTNLLEKAQPFEIQVYKKPKDVKQLKNTHVPYTGSPQKHPCVSEKIIIVIDPYSSATVYYEFFTTDISYVEELPSLVNINGETVQMARIWVKKMSLGICCAPFLVENITK